MQSGLRRQSEVPVTRQLLRRQHSAGHLLTRLFTGGGVHIEILEEHLGSTVLVVVRALPRL